jgi:hypothetical protein
MEIILILQMDIILKVLHNKKITITTVITIIIRITIRINKRVMLVNLIPRNKRYIILKIVLILMIVLVGI